MSRENRIILLGLAMLCVASLIFVSWEMCRLSSWIVGADHIWGEMDKTGHGSEHYAAEAFQAVSPELLWGEATVGLAFVIFLGRCCSRRRCPSLNGELSD